MAEYILGQASILAVWDGTDSYDPLVCLTSHNLSESVEEIATRTKCDAGGATQKKAGAYSYEIGFEGVYSKPEASKMGWVTLKNKLRSLGNFDWRITTTYADGSTETEYGSGFFSNLELTANLDEDITFSGSLMGSGLITDTDPNA
jgi:predicted secreted protein